MKKMTELEQWQTQALAEYKKYTKALIKQISYVDSDGVVRVHDRVTDNYERKLYWEYNTFLWEQQKSLQAEEDIVYYEKQGRLEVVNRLAKDRDNFRARAKHTWWSVAQKMVPYKEITGTEYTSEIHLELESKYLKKVA